MTEENKLPEKDESIIKKIYKKRWVIGSDTVELSLEYFSDKEDGYFVSVSYFSVKTMQKLYEIHASEQSQESQEKMIPKGL